MTRPNTLRFEPSQRRTIHRPGLLAVGLLVGFLLSPQRAPAEELAPEQVAKLLGFNSQSTLVVTHWRWRALLGYYVKGAGDGKFLINYWGVTPKAEDWLEKYIESLSEMNWSALNRDEQLAGWINFYNALSLKLVLEKPPGRRLKQKLRYPVRDSGPFLDKQVTVLGVPLSAHDIRKILLTGWADPRIHYALMGVAVGGPSINPLPYWGKYVDRQLDDAARRFVNSRSGILIRSKKVYASRLFDWYQSDFGGSDSAVLDHVRHFADAKLLANLEERTTIADYRYSWYLPGAHRKRYRALHFPRCWGQGRGGTHGGRGC